MIYSDWVTAIVTLVQPCSVNDPKFSPAAANPTPDYNFNAYIPTAIINAETRIQREFDFIGCYVTDTSGALTPGARLFTLPTTLGVFQVVSQVSLTVGGLRNPPILPVGRDFLEQVYPADGAVGLPSIPSYWCPVNQVSILVGPAPDAAYPVAVVGTQRLTPMSSTNTSNFISVNMPDLYLCASMVEWSGYQRDYGAGSDDPKLAVSWEGRYQELMKSADIEEMRKKFMSTGWQSRQPAPLATPPQS